MDFMPPIGILLTIATWVMFAMAGIGLFFWLARWFPRQRWLAPTLLLLFVVFALLARQTKWMVPLFVAFLLLGSGFIPRKR
jgi:hypothetical protein